tara:strand:+ start:358 stop:738 length:381 start_codon:yes stop_codon:yes gene_type:complete
MLQLPNELWMSIYHYKSELERKAAKLIAERIENHIYYHVYKSTFSFEITRRLFALRSTDYVNFLLEKPGLRYEFKNMNFWWAEELNKEDGYVDMMLIDIETDFRYNNLWDLYLPVDTTSVMIGGCD